MGKQRNMERRGRGRKEEKGVGKKRKGKERRGRGRKEAEQEKKRMTGRKMMRMRGPEKGWRRMEKNWEIKAEGRGGRGTG